MASRIRIFLGGVLLLGLLFGLSACERTVVDPAQFDLTVPYLPPKLKPLNGIEWPDPVRLGLNATPEEATYTRILRSLRFGAEPRHLEELLHATLAAHTMSAASEYGYTLLALFQIVNGEHEDARKSLLDGDHYYPNGPYAGVRNELRKSLEALEKK